MAGGGNLGKASLVLTTKDQTGKGLGKAEGGIKSWASGLKGKVGGALAGIGAAVAAFGAAAKLGERFDSLAEVGKQSAALGVASDQFMGLAAAAKMAGVDADAFGEILQEGTLRVAEGSADTSAALGQIGLSLDQLRGKSGDEVFYAVAEGLSGVADQGTRASVTARLFGDEGMKLVGVLSQGEGSLRGFVEQQKAMGTALKQSDMGGILNAQARMAQIGQRVEGLMNRLVVMGVPFLEIALDIADAVIDWLPAFEDAKTVGLAVFQVIGQAGAYVWDTLRAGAGGAAIALGGWAAVAGKAMQAVGMAKEGADALKLGEEMAVWGGGQIGTFGQSAKDVENWFQNLGNKAAPKIGEKIGQKAGEQMAKAFEYRQNAAVERGSREDWSARIRWDQRNETLQQQQAQKAAETAKNTAATVEAIKSLPAKLNMSQQPLKVV